MRSCILLLATVFIAAPAAYADLTGTVTGHFTGVMPGQDLSIRADGLTSALSTRAGIYTFDKLSSTGAGGYVSDPYGSFCVDLEQYVYYEDHTWNVAAVGEAPRPPGDPWAPMGPVRADKIAELWGRHFAQVVDNTTAAAFQLAVWEIVYQTAGSYDVTSGWTSGSGGFQVTTSGLAYIKNLANQWLWSLDGTGPRASLASLTSDTRQDFIVAIPVPAAALLGVLGLGLVGWAKRRLA